MSSETPEKLQVHATTTQSALAFGGVISILMIGLLVFKADIHVLLIMTLIWSTFMATRAGMTVDQSFNAMGQSLKDALIGIFIFLIIGMLIGSWISGGTIPSLIYYGVQWITPSLFLPAGFLLCSVVSAATGTSWGTVGTVGLALMGMGAGMGLDPALVAGCVVSGSIVGDKVSPISDTTILAATASGADLYDHVKAMLMTTIPSMLICVALFYFMGHQYEISNTANSVAFEQLMTTLEASFNLSPITLLPLIVVLVLSLMKKPAVPVLLTGVILGSVLAVVMQGSSVIDAISALNYGFSIDSGVADIDKLLNRGGIQSMMWTLSLAIIALCLGGVLAEAKFLSTLMTGILKYVKKPASTMALTSASSALGCAATSETYISIILNGNLFRDVYKKRGLQPALCSRLVEEGATVFCFLIPWTTSGAFAAGALGVSVQDYFPYALFGFIDPILSIILAYCGIFILKAKKNETLPEQSTRCETVGNVG